MVEAHEIGQRGLTPYLRGAILVGIPSAVVLLALLYFMFSAWSSIGPLFSQYFSVEESLGPGASDQQKAIAQQHEQQLEQQELILLVLLALCPVLIILLMVIAGAASALANGLVTEGDALWSGRLTGGLTGAIIFLAGLVFLYYTLPPWGNHRIDAMGLIVIAHLVLPFIVTFVAIVFFFSVGSRIVVRARSDSRASVNGPAIFLKNCLIASRKWYGLTFLLTLAIYLLLAYYVLLIFVFNAH